MGTTRELGASGKIRELLGRNRDNLKSVKDNQQTINNGRCIQECVREIRKGNINSGMILLTDNMQHGALLLNKQTLRHLKQKHPQGSKADPGVLLSDIPEEIHPIMFDLINAESVRKTRLNTRA